MSSSVKSFLLLLFLFAAGPEGGTRWVLAICYERKKNRCANNVQKHGGWVAGVKGEMKLVAHKDKRTQTLSDDMLDKVGQYFALQHDLHQMSKKSFEPKLSAQTRMWLKRDHQPRHSTSCDEDSTKTNSQ